MFALLGRLIRNFVVFTLTVIVVLGALKWLGSGLSPADPGYWKNSRANTSIMIGWGEDVATGLKKLCGKPCGGK